MNKKYFQELMAANAMIFSVMCFAVTGFQFGLEMGSFAKIEGQTIKISEVE